MSVPFEYHRQIPTASAQLPLRPLFQPGRPRVGEWPGLVRNVISQKVAARVHSLIVSAVQLGACTASTNREPVVIGNRQGRGLPLLSRRHRLQGHAPRKISG